MTNIEVENTSVEQLLLRAGIPALMTWLFIPLSFVIPSVDSTRAPYFDLTDTFSQMVYWVSQSGGTSGAPVVAVLMLFVLVSRNGMTTAQRWKETVAIALLAAVCAGGGAAINEHVVKPELKIPRPNIVWLAEENGAGPLGMTPESFYEKGDKEARRVPLATVLQAIPKPVLLSPSIESHWIEETGYSFPSGHSFAAMFFATFLLSIAVVMLNTKRIWLFYLLLPWALAVCYSRPILRLHTPVDITIGSLQGLVIGLIAAVIAMKLIRQQ